MSKRSFKRAVAAAKVTAIPSKKKGNGQDAIQLYNVYK